MERTDEERREDSLCDRIGSLEREKTKLLERIKELEAEYLNEKRMAAKAYTACGNYQQRIKGLETEIQEVANQLMELYDKCNETTEPEVYGTILGLHESLEEALKRL